MTMTEREWRVVWISFGGETRFQTFDSEAAARVSLLYCTTGWGSAATAQLSGREVGPWEPEPKIGPRALDYDNARVL